MVLIIIVSLAGILYFGYVNIKKNHQKNPYEYNIEGFKRNPDSLNIYTEKKPIKLNYSKVYGICIDLNDFIYVSGDLYVLKLDPDGNIILKIITQGPVFCLEVAKNNTLFLGKEKHVSVVDPKGKQLYELNEFSNDNTYITSLAIAGNDIYIADAGNLIVWKINLLTKNKIRIGEKNQEQEIPGFVIPSYYFDLTFDSDGFLWVTNPGRHCLENYTSEGNLRSSWGKYSMGIEGFCGCCNPTNIAILDNDFFVTSEKGIARVKVYDRLGDLVGVVAGADQFNEGTKGLDLAIDSKQQIYVLDPSRKLIRIFKKNE